MEKGIFFMNSVQLRYALVLTGMMCLLALLLWLNLIGVSWSSLTTVTYYKDGEFYIIATVFFCVIILLTLIGALFLLKKANALNLHIAVVCAFAYNIWLYISAYNIYYNIYLTNISALGSLNISFASIIIACLLFLFYIGGFFVLKRKYQSPNNDRFYLFGIALFTTIGILTDMRFWWYGIWNPTIFSAFLILVPLIYLLFYWIKKIKLKISYITIGITVILTLIDISVNHDNLVQLFGMLILVIILFVAYIVYDRMILSGANKTKNTPVSSTRPAARSFDEKVEKLHELQTLHIAGVLTEEEFQTEKKKILGGNEYV